MAAITVELLEDAQSLAAKGYTNIIIADSLGIAASTCTNNKLLKLSIKEGRSQARKLVVDALMQRSLEDQSPTAAIFLCKQLKIFDEHYPTSTPKSAEDALKKIASIFVSVARNELSQEKGTHLIGYLESYLKGHLVHDYDVRLEELEERYKNDNK